MESEFCYQSKEHFTATVKKSKKEKKKKEDEKGKKKKKKEKNRGFHVKFGKYCDLRSKYRLEI